MEKFEDIYLSLLGCLIPEYAVPWVDNAFATGALCDQEYERMRRAYERLCARLGVAPEDEDGDLNTMVDAMESIQEDLCLHLYQSLCRHYGIDLQQTQANGPSGT